MDPGQLAKSDGKKRRVDAGSSSAGAAKPAAPPVIRLLGNLKKDTLQNICEDLTVTVSGNKDELISRIVDAIRAK